VDLVFSDVQMPGRTDGFALASWVRANLADLPILLTSGVGHPASAVAGLRLNGPMIPKPYRHEAVLGEIHRASRRRSQSG
jgi:DNA-binding NtrC family response regulator